MKVPINQYLHQLRIAAKANPELKLILFSIGNPEPAYTSTRHNVGHFVCQHLVREFNAEPALVSSKLKTWEGAAGYENIILASSQEYMNLSGHAMANLLRTFGPDSWVIVIHDDMALSVGEIKFKLHSSSYGGHNGLKSLGRFGELARLRIGIGAPPAMSSAAVTKYVLGKFTLQEKAKLALACESASMIFKSLIKELPRKK